MFDAFDLDYRFDIREKWDGYHDCFTAGPILAPICPWVEIGGGSGALARSIREAGGRCVSTDLHEWFYFEDGIWDRGNTIHADAERVVRLVSRYPKIGLLCAWPSYDEDWCFRAVRHLVPGQLFAYIGEGWGGCTGSEELHDLLAAGFEIVSEHRIDQIPGIHDELVIYRRRVDAGD